MSEIRFDRSLSPFDCYSEASVVSYIRTALCLREKLRVSVVRFCLDIFTTEAPRTHRDTEKNQTRETRRIDVVGGKI